DRFNAVAGEMAAYLASVGITAQAMIPVAARDGDNIATQSTRMAWSEAPTVVEALDHLAGAPRQRELPLRFPIQDVYKFDTRRILAGRIEAGRIARGDRLVFSPSGKTARIATIEAWNAAEPVEALAGEAIGLTLDEQIFVERGEIASHEDAPPVLTDVFKARI